MATAGTSLIISCRDSPQPRSSDGDSTGYSTDYNTFEISRKHKRTERSSRNLLSDALPDRTLRVEVGNNSGDTRTSSTVENGEAGGLQASAEELKQHRQTVRLRDDLGEDDSEEEEDVMRDEHHICPLNIYCSLIPSGAIYHWQICRGFCCIWMALLVVGAVITLAVGLFWTVEIFEQRPDISKTMDLTTSGIYNLTSIFPSSNMYGTGLCLSFEQPVTDAVKVSKLAYVTLISKSCRDLTTTYNYESFSHNSDLQYNSYMFHWHRGTFFSLYVSGSSLVAIYLLNDRVSENYCSEHLKPDNIVKEWILNFSKPDADQLDWYVNTTNTYYLCINTTIYTQLSYNMTISSVVYNTSSSKLSLDCTQGDACCLPFDGLLSEALHPTCMYVSTRPLDPSFIGMELVNVNLHVSQRVSVIFYSLVLLVAILFILFITVLYYSVILYKVKHADFKLRSCTIYCSLFGKIE